MDLDALTDTFVPERLLHREGQVQAVLEALTSGSCFVWGPTGTGKTCGAQAVLGELKGNGVKGAYVNCWKHSTKFGVLAEALRGWDRFVLRQGAPYDEAVKGLEKGGARTVVLDEVDKLEDDGIVYDFLSAGVRLLLISNEEHALARLDSRIRSRLAGLEQTEFPRYRDEELTDILRERVRDGVATAQLRRIADAAAGDCRVALATLRKAVERAERAGRQIEDKDVDAAVGTATVLRHTLTVNDYQKLLLQIIRQKEQIQTGDLMKTFLELCKERHLQTVQPRTFAKYMEELAASGMVKVAGENRWRVYSV